MKRVSPVFQVGILYSVLFAVTVSALFYTGQTAWLAHAYLGGLLLFLPFLFLGVYLERKKNYGDVMSGRDGVKTGLKMVVLVIVLLSIFQAIFFYAGFYEFKANYIRTVGPNVLKDQITSGQIKLTLEQIPQAIEADVAGITVVKEITAVVFKYLFYGAFSSFIAAVFLKKS